MRYTRINTNTVIRSPWLSSEEAAVYCEMGINRFRELAKRTSLPRAITSSSNKPRYNARVLDEWMQSDLTVAHLARIDEEAAL